MPLPPFVTRNALDPSALPSKPSIRPEKSWSQSHPDCWVAGIDEAGRGPLAGPVVAAAVVFSFSKKRPSGINDSKKMTHEQRVGLAEEIKSTALAWGIGRAEPWEIDAINILQATKLASCRAIETANELLGKGQGQKIGALVTDALDLPNYPCPQLALIKGDQRSVSVAAASILAKVERDEIVCRVAQEYPDYGWIENKGYPTPDHRRALELHGPSSWHRFSYKPVHVLTTQVVRSRACERILTLAFSTQPQDFEAVASLIAEFEAATKLIPAEDRRFLATELGARFSEFVKKNTNFSLEIAANP